jgi:FKBP-type peptidyl-prolyl cis-trans isomerase SlyD
MSIINDQVVSIHYTLKNDNEDIIDTSEGKPPLDFIFGKGTVIKGLEKALADKNVGDSFNVSIPPEDAYGFELMENIKTVPRSQFEDPESVKIGTRFQIESGAVAVVTNADDSSVSLDLNHPLAGQTLHFDISVEDLRDATTKELEHGHVHGPESTCS